MTEKTANRMTLTLASDREIEVTRAFDAPRDLVYAAMSSCEHIAKWWGPRGFELIGCEMDLRPGGSYRFVQKAPDGSIHPFHGVYREIAAPERVVFTQVYEPMPSEEMVVTTTLSEAGGRTVLSQLQLFSSQAARDGMIASGMESGEAQSFDRLEELLVELRAGAAGGDSTAALPKPSGPQLSITRDFDAPRDLVWKVWTDPERLARWWGPAGSEISVASLDLRPGGAFHYSMRTGGGPDIWGRFIYHDVSPQERLVFSSTFSDENGGITRNPWVATWPLEVQNTLTLIEVDGRTRLTLRGGPINATAEELAAFAAGLDGMEKGFAGTFKRLDDYLAETLARA